MVDAFISYRRKPSASLAQLVQEKLKNQHTIDAYVDTTRTDSTRVQFPERLMQAIADAPVFICLLGEGTLESEWVHKEIQRAYELGKHCIPVFQESYVPPTVEDSAVDYLLAFDGVHIFDVKAVFMDESIGQIAALCAPPKTPAPASQPPRFPIMRYLAAILALAVLIAVVLLVVLPNLNPVNIPTPTLTHTQAVVAVGTTSETLAFTEAESPFLQPSETPTPSETASPQPTETPTLSETQMEMTITSEYGAILNEIQQTNAADATGTAAALTATADSWTETPTPDARRTAEARVTRDAIAAATQGVVDATATANAWTDTPTATRTPTPTHTFTPTHTPTSTLTHTPDPVVVALEQARNFTGDENTDWVAFATTFPDDPAAAPMVLVPVGSFQMGSTVNTDEQPVHTQTFDQPFWIDQTEVTRGQWGLCVAEGACPAKTGNQYSERDEQPVNYVTWFEARDYCVWRAEVTGEDYRLPTEREWEYAARGVESWTYPWGSESPTDDLAVYYPTANETADVGSKPDGVSWVGALDMSGNVWEWVNTIYGIELNGDYDFSDSGESLYNYPYVANDGREADTGERTDVLRVLRGGSFYGNANGLRGAFRGRNNPNYENDVMGFRCALS